MDCCLIAVGWTDPSMWIAALEVAVGLGFVIFVHELGHFAVAKMCGVKVDKFFIGFDIGGLKLCSFRWGETLYGIGILPLGGYVKMLGQEDNPAQLRKEMERARQEAASGSATGRGRSRQRRRGGRRTVRRRRASAEKRLFDPRSYLAKSVPQRMAIISAGVIMNMIFALVFAVVAFAFFGVKQNPTVVGSVMAGGAAWQAGVQADDEILEVAGRKVHNFRHMTEEIVNADLAHGIPLLIQRPGVKDPLDNRRETRAVGRQADDRRRQFGGTEARQREERAAVRSGIRGGQRQGPVPARRSHRANRRPADRHLRPASRFPGRSRR